MKKKSSHHEPSQRQLRVGEQIRHALAEILMRGEAHIDDLESTSVTISEVRISPDLKHAHAYVSSLMQDDAHVVEVLNEHHVPLRHQLTKKLKHMKFSPKLHFKLDPSFDEAMKIDSLLRNPAVQRDLKSSED